MTEKLYCNVDETGQDTKGKLFIVVAILMSKNRDAIAEELLIVEQRTNKRLRKWVKSKQNLNYINKALSAERFKDKIFYKNYQGPKDYDALTIRTIILAINRYAREHKLKRYRVMVIVDGLKVKHEPEYAVAIRREGIVTEKVKGAKDGGYPILRLADAVAGLIREGEEGRKEYQSIRKQLEFDGVLAELE